MSITQLLFRKGNYISTIQLDIIVTESASANVRVTENPVENGANVNDHIIVEPMTFFVEGVVSDISSSFIGALSSTAFNRGNQKSKEAWEALLQLQVDRTPFTLVQGLKEYPNVIILSLTEQQDKDTANGLFFTATMREIIYVGVEIITASQFNDSNIADKMVPTIQGGQKLLQG